MTETLVSSLTTYPLEPLVVEGKQEKQDWPKISSNAFAYCLITIASYSTKALESNQKVPHMSLIELKMSWVPRTIATLKTSLDHIWHDAATITQAIHYRNFRIIQEASTVINSVTDFKGLFTVALGRDHTTTLKIWRGMKKIVNPDVKIAEMKGIAAKFTFTLLAIQIVKEYNKSLSNFEFIKTTYDKFSMTNTYRNSMLLLMSLAANGTILKSIAKDSVGHNTSLLGYVTEIETKAKFTSTLSQEIASHLEFGQVQFADEFGVRAGIQTIAQLVQNRFLIDPVYSFLGTEKDLRTKSMEVEIEVVKLLKKEALTSKEKANRETAYYLLAKLAEASNVVSTKVEFAHTHIALLNASKISEFNVSMDILYHGHVLLLKNKELAYIASHMFVDRYQTAEMIIKCYDNLPPIIFDTFKLIVPSGERDKEFYDAAMMKYASDNKYVKRYKAPVPEWSDVDSTSDTLNDKVTTFLSTFVRAAFQQAKGSNLSDGATRNINQVKRLVVELRIIERYPKIWNWKPFWARQDPYPEFTVEQEFEHLVYIITGMNIQQVTENPGLKVLVQNILIINDIVAKAIANEYLPHLFRDKEMVYTAPFHKDVIAETNGKVVEWFAIFRTEAGMEKIQSYLYKYQNVIEDMGVRKWFEAYRNFVRPEDIIPVNN